MHPQVPTDACHRMADSRARACTSRGDLCALFGLDIELENLFTQQATHGLPTKNPQRPVCARDHLVQFPWNYFAIAHWLRSRYSPQVEIGGLASGPELGY